MTKNSASRRGPTTSVRRWVWGAAALAGLVAVFNCNGGGGCNGCSGGDGCGATQTCEQCIDQCVYDLGGTPDNCRVSVCGDVCEQPPPQ
jgi:hypothetical protein